MTGRTLDTLSHLTKSHKSILLQYGEEQGTHCKVTSHPGKFMTELKGSYQARRMSSTPSVPLSPRVRLIQSPPGPVDIDVKRKCSSQQPPLSGLVVITVREPVSCEELGNPSNFSGADFRDGGYYIRFVANILSRKDPAHRGCLPDSGLRLRGSERL